MPNTKAHRARRKLLVRLTDLMIANRRVARVQAVRTQDDASAVLDRDTAAERLADALAAVLEPGDDGEAA